MRRCCHLELCRKVLFGPQNYRPAKEVQQAGGGEVQLKPGEQGGQAACSLGGIQ